MAQIMMLIDEMFERTLDESKGVMMNKHEDYQDALNDIIHNTLNNWEYKK